MRALLDVNSLIALLDEEHVHHGEILEWLTRADNLQHGFATCAITGTEVKNVAKPMMKYLIVLAAGLLALIFVPEFSLWLPRTLGIL